MKSLLNKISSNQAVTRFLNGDRGLMINDILSLSYLICASFYKKKQNYSIVAPNLYVAQNIYEQISAIIKKEKFNNIEVEDAMLTRREKGNCSLVFALSDAVTSGKIAIDQALREVDLRNQDLIKKIVAQSKNKRIF